MAKALAMITLLSCTMVSASVQTRHRFSSALLSVVRGWGQPFDSCPVRPLGMSGDEDLASERATGGFTRLLAYRQISACRKVRLIERWMIVGLQL